jgi:uncharacterized protein YeaO (DUF488 family)
MPVSTRRWNDPADVGAGLRILITRYRPRGVSKIDETWDRWMPNLGPSKELLAHFKGRDVAPIDWATYRKLYLTEMRRQTEAIRELAERVAAGESITLLCSSTCVRESRCHRSLLRELIEAEVARFRQSSHHAI